MFNSSGEKVQSIAKIVFGVFVAVAIIQICAVMVYLGSTSKSKYEAGANGGLLFGGLLVAALIIFAGWILALFLHAFGDLVESNMRMADTIENLSIELSACNMGNNNETSCNIANNDNNINYVDRVKQGIYTILFENGKKLKIEINGNDATWEEIVAAYKKGGYYSNIKFLVDEKGNKICGK